MIHAPVFKLTINLPAQHRFFDGDEVVGMRILIDGERVLFRPVSSLRGDDRVRFRPRPRGGYESFVEGSLSAGLLAVLMRQGSAIRPFFTLHRASKGWIGIKNFTEDGAPPKFTPHIRVWPPRDKIDPAQPPISDEITMLLGNFARVVRTAHQIVAAYEQTRPIGRPPSEVIESRKVLDAFNRLTLEVTPAINTMQAMLPLRTALVETIDRFVQQRASWPEAAAMVPGAAAMRLAALHEAEDAVQAAEDALAPWQEPEPAPEPEPVVAPAARGRPRRTPPRQPPAKPVVVEPIAAAPAAPPVVADAAPVKRGRGRPRKYPLGMSRPEQRRAAAAAAAIAAGLAAPPAPVDDASSAVAALPPAITAAASKQSAKRPAKRPAKRKTKRGKRSVRRVVRASDGTVTTKRLRAIVPARPDRPVKRHPGGVVTTPEPVRPLGPAWTLNAVPIEPDDTHWPPQEAVQGDWTGMPTVARTIVPETFVIAAETEPVPPETVAPEAVTPETVAPEAVAPEAVTPETVAPEAVTPETVAPETVAPEVVAPEVVAPEAVAPETVAPETVAAERVVHDSRASAAVPEPTVPEPVVAVTPPEPVAPDPVAAEPVAAPTADEPEPVTKDSGGFPIESVSIGAAKAAPVAPEQGAPERPDRAVAASVLPPAPPVAAREVNRPAAVLLTEDADPDFIELYPDDDTVDEPVQYAGLVTAAANDADALDADFIDGDDGPIDEPMDARQEPQPETEDQVARRRAAAQTFWKRKKRMAGSGPTVARRR